LKEVIQIIAAYDNNLQQHEIFNGDDPQSILNRAAFQGDLINVENILANRKQEDKSVVKYQHPLKLASIRGYLETVKTILPYSPLDAELLIKLLWHSSINLRSNVVEYLLRNSALNETLLSEEIQKILFRIGNKYKVTAILQKDFPIFDKVTSPTLNEERQRNLTETIRLLYSKIPVRIDQQRILDQFLLTEENIEKLALLTRFIIRARKESAPTMH